jgi:HD-GYP domain-containing protein (c-di-GMP phosphodiesterase class II)
MTDGSVPQHDTLGHRDQASPVPPIPGSFIEHFIKLSRTLARLTTADAVAQAVGSTAVTLAGARGGAVMLQTGAEPSCRWSDGIPADQLAGLAAAARRPGSPAAVWPLAYRGATLGTLICCFEEPRTWSASEADVMSALALQGAAALARVLAGGTPEDAAASGTDDARIADALRILQDESAELTDAHTRLLRTQRELGALSVWLLAVQTELRAERARLAEEQTRLEKARSELESETARVSAAREALDAELSAARRELDKESERLAEMRRHLFEEPRRPANGRREPPADAARPTHAELLQALEQDAAPAPETLRRLQEVAIPQPEPPSSANGTPDDGDVLAAALRLVTPDERARDAAIPDGAEASPTYELGGPLPAPRTVDELFPLLIERAAKLLNKERRSLETEEQVALLARVLDDRDGHRTGYSERLAAWAEATAGVMGAGRDEIADIRRAALLHDLGKIGVPETILRASVRLSDKERRIVRLVPALADRVLRPVKGMQGVAAILRHRYEQWDGQGYPDGLAGEDIALGARILAVADAYGVMTTIRPYRAMVYSMDAVAELRRCAGAQFDPRVVDAFYSVLKREG